MKLNLGCGENRIPGFENHDADVDLRKPLPWPDNSAEFILLEHVLEHFNCAVGYGILEECYRVLAPRGVLRVVVPDVARIYSHATIQYCDFLISRGWGSNPIKVIATRHGHEMLWTIENLKPVMASIGYSFLFSPDYSEYDGHSKIIGDEFNKIERLALQGLKP